MFTEFFPPDSSLPVADVTCPESASQPEQIAEAALKAYLHDLRFFAGADYVPARAKDWWLP